MDMPPPTSPLQARMQSHRSPSATIMRDSQRSSSRWSMNSRPAAPATPSKASDEESKTAVKVAIRVRPPLEPSDPGYDLIPQRFRTSTCEVTSPTNLAIQSNQGRKLFVFDRVFGEDVDQQGVWNYVKDGVASFVQGYNVSILAYGQSGAGKSYTMGTSGPGEQSHSSMRGVVPRAAEALFDQLSGTPAGPKSGLRSPQRYSTHGLPTLQTLNRQQDRSDRTWTLTATYVEIYNEQLRDLLVPDTTPMHERPQVSIREDTKGRILLTGLTQVDINSVDDLLNALNFGSSIRQTDATAINAKSSRSHAVFSLNLVQTKPAGSEHQSSRQDRRMSMPLEGFGSSEGTITTDSKLHFVDLAGSERLKNTGAQGERAKEGISINAGLASLGKVISQLSSRQAGTHISYRDSRLTRLLQDSLGGNAITYMIACITPTEFHLSETLNTVHYAQRARAIQSKPEIQQTSNDADRNAMIERLQAEIAFLREQISNERDQRSVDVSERPHHRRTVELQDQLMDMQESYNALSQRHAKLISELGKTRDDPNADTPTLHEAIGGSAVDRLQRSSSFAEAVETVVLEYEKTIQSLESSLLNTRSSLSNTESNLMERENKIAYMETASSQLQSRLQKMLEREASNDRYLRELETRLEGATSNEEDTSSLIKGLRTELAKAKDNQSSSEDYISTLEEKLAEAEQDHDTLKRELERLEQVIERQRSIARLDNMMADVDSIRHIEQNGSYPSGRRNTNGSLRLSRDNAYNHAASPPSPLDEEAIGLGIEDRSQGCPSPVSPLLEEEMLGQPAIPTIRQPKVRRSSRAKDNHEQSAAQLKFMADKLEALTQELFDLQGEHEYTVADHQELQQKYSVALQTLARLQDTDGEESPIKTTPTRSETFLGHHEAASPSKPGHPALLHSSSSELPSQSPSTSSSQQAIPHINTSLQHDQQTDEDVDPFKVPLPRDTPTEQTEGGINISPKQFADLRELSLKHAQLLDSHQDALVQIERLKSDNQRMQIEIPSPSRKSPLLRRKPSVDANVALGNVDRANRSFASLRNIALDHFESNVDVRQNFELQLNTIMTELHGRTEKVHEAEADLMTLRKQLDDKATIIAGLTRERSKLKSSPNVDFSVVGQMQDQLAESKQHIQTLQETSNVREAQLQAEIEKMKSQLEDHQRSRADSLQADAGAQDGYTNDEAQRLRQELSAWQTKHAELTKSKQASESDLMATIATLESSLNASAEKEHGKDVGTDNDSASALELERQKHNDVVQALQKEIDDHKLAGKEQVGRLESLQRSHAGILEQIESDKADRSLTEQELQTHRDLVSNLEKQLNAHKAAAEAHQKSLASLEDKHKTNVSHLKATAAAAEKTSSQRYAALQRQHNDAMDELEAEIKSHQEGLTDLLASAAAALGHETNVSKLSGHIRNLNSSKKELEDKHAQTSLNAKIANDKLRAALATNQELEGRIEELKDLHNDAMLNLDKAIAREAKSSRLVQELEDQLNSNYDDNQASTNRLSAMQSEKQLQLQEALHARAELEKEVEDQRLRISFLESHISDIRRRSGTPTARDSTAMNRESLSPEAAAIALGRSNSASSAVQNRSPTHAPTALPSPPPSVPLPPLPGASLDHRATSPLPTLTPSRPVSSHVPHPSIDSHLTQVVEEQEARIRTIEKHLFAEKQLTATLEEALVDLETAQTKSRTEADGWRKRAVELEDEVAEMRREHSVGRASVQAVEEEREARVRAENARVQLEGRMRELSQLQAKKKKGRLNCF